MLYSLGIEPLLRKFRVELKGVNIPNCEFFFKLSAYADDIVILIKEQRNVNKMTKIVSDFTIVSSAKVNWKKVRLSHLVNGQMDNLLSLWS